MNNLIYKYEVTLTNNTNQTLYTDKEVTVSYLNTIGIPVKEIKTTSNIHLLTVTQMEKKDK